MADSLGIFQSKLSGVMETVFKAAMYEISRLVEDSFLEDVKRCREQVESLERRLEWSENRRKEMRDDGQLRWADFERVEMSNEEKPKAFNSELNLKQEYGLEEGMNSHKGSDGQTWSSEVEASQSSNVQNIDRLLKEEAINLTPQAKDSEDFDATKCPHLLGPSKHSRFPKSHIYYEAGFDQRPESTVDSGDQSEPLLQNRYVMKDLGGFEKTDYGVTSMIYNLDDLQGSSSQLSNDLTYMSHYGRNAEAQVEAKGQTFQTDEQGHHSGTMASAAGSTTRANTDLMESNCLLINEEGYIQNQRLVTPASASNDSDGRLSLKDQGIHIDTSLDSPGAMYGSSNGYTTCDTTHFGERFQVQAAGKGNKRHICNLCSLSFPDSATLKGHRQTHRGIEQGPPYFCEHCGKTFTQSWNLKVHQKIHSGQGLHLCSQCGRNFPSLEDLKNHKCGQTGNKPFGCTVCGNKFSRLWNLKLHQRIHTQEKPHQCTTCNKRFTRADILKVHQRTHTGERPYCCTMCGLAFKRQDHLKSHQRKHLTDL